MDLRSRAAYFPSARLFLLFASIQKVRRSAASARALAGGMFIHEIETISRMITETVVNAAYLQHGEDSEIDRFLHDGSPSVARSGITLPRRAKFSIIKRLLRTESAETRMKGKGLALRTEPRWSVRSLAEKASFADAAIATHVITLLLNTLHARGHSAVCSNFHLIAPYLPYPEHRTPAVEDQTSSLEEALFGINLSLMTLCLYTNTYLDLDMDQLIYAAAQVPSANRHQTPSLYL